MTMYLVTYKIPVYRFIESKSQEEAIGEASKLPYTELVERVSSNCMDAVEITAHAQVGIRGGGMSCPKGGLM
jgi:hypothetical protein